MKYFRFDLAHKSGGKSGQLTVNALGNIIDYDGFSEQDSGILLSLHGFAQDPSHEIDMSARFALSHDVNLTAGMVPILNTERGRGECLYTVVAAAEVARPPRT